MSSNESFSSTIPSPIREAKTGRLVYNSYRLITGLLTRNSLLSLPLFCQGGINHSGDRISSLITSVGSETAPITEFELACLVVALVVLP